MKIKPVSITIISWILIVLSGVGMVSSIVTYSVNEQAIEILKQTSHIPLQIQFLIAGTALIVQAICGIGFLQGLNWSRILFVVSSIAGILYSYLTSPIKVTLIFSVVFFGVVCFFLFRPISNKFFGNQKET
ncbi:hypothetical protein [Leptospira saintgironsiae]|uniref:DUF4064 domain-containing protein n=1 Tax=Leptospira saintgironsiae TaxID=2023183 RepID=A0A2M9YGT8_9LEPT|nr:hypothetical protein [Leptospira saintgironsiae]PJZ50723.1 hypothetical protein CH362_02870 [Leptospira saintgironsiae]